MGAPLLKILLLINLCIAFILACVALGRNPTLNLSPKSTHWNVVIAFNSLALILLLTALVLTILLFVGFSERHPLFLIIIAVLVGVSCICFAVATGVTYNGLNEGHGPWLLSGTWMTVMSIVISIIFIFMGSEA